MMAINNPGQAYGGSPQRRFLSEGELVRQGNELSYARSNNTVDNIRELAGSPQRGVYMWKDTSPGVGPTGGIGSSAGTMPGIHHSHSQQQQQQPQPQQYMTIGGQPHPLIMTQSRLHQQATQQQHQQQQYELHHNRSNPTSPTIPNSMPTSMQTSQSYMDRANVLRYGVGAPGSSAGGGGGISSLSNNCAAAVAAQAQSNFGHTTTQTIASGGGGSGTTSGYQPQLRGGVPVFPPNPIAVAIGNSTSLLQSQPSPQIKRKQTPTRPMSFVRALEMTDSMEMQTLEQQQQQQQQQSRGVIMNSTSQIGTNMPSVSGSSSSNIGIGGGPRATTPTPDRASVYDMNYEISV